MPQAFPAPSGAARATGALLSLLLAGCMATGPQGERARLRDGASLPSAKALAAASSARAGADTAWPAQDWWRAYGDPQLDALIVQARADSPTIAAALARVRQAAALEGVAAAALGPQANAGARSARQRYSENGSVPKPLAGSWQWVNDASLGLSVELDFWGRQRAAIAAAAGRVRAQRAESEAAALAVSTAVAQAYFRLDLLFRQRDLAEAELRQREQILDLVGKRVKAQLDSQAELKQAEIGVPLARGQIAALDEAIALTRGQLAALAGQGQDAAAAIRRPQLKDLRKDVRKDVRNTGVPAELPAALLGRRPELVALRWRVEAASGDIDAAKAQFYPSVNLSALVGLQSLGFERLLQGGSLAASAGPAISLPLLDGGRLRSQLAARNAEYDLAVEQYNGAVVEAMRDVVAQLTSLQALDARLREQDLALAAAEDAYALALRRYRAGLGTFLQVLVADTQVVAQRRARADLAARANELDLNLVRALGGGHS